MGRTRKRTPNGVRRRSAVVHRWAGLGLALVLLVEAGTGTLLLYRRELAGDGADGPFWGLLLNLHDCGLACPHLPGHVPALAAAVPGLGGTTWGGLGLGVLGAALVGLALSGVAAWWPVRRFGRAVRATLQPKFDRGPFRLHRDLHDLAALAVLPLLLVWAVTGAVNGVLGAGPGMTTGAGGLGLHSGASVPGWARVPWVLAGLAVLYVAGSGVWTWRFRTRRTRRAVAGRAPAIPRQRTPADPRVAGPGAPAAGAGRPAVGSGTGTTGPGHGPAGRTRTGPGSGSTGSGSTGSGSTGSGSTGSGSTGSGSTDSGSTAAGAPAAVAGAPPGLPDHVVAGSVVADAAAAADRHGPAAAPGHGPPGTPGAPRLPATVPVPTGVGRPVLPAMVPVPVQARPREHAGCREPALRTVALVVAGPGGGAAPGRGEVVPPPVAASATGAVPHPAAGHGSSGAASLSDAGTSPATVTATPTATRNGPVAPVPAQRRHPPEVPSRARGRDTGAEGTAGGGAAVPGPPAPCDSERRARNPYTRRRRRRPRGRRS